MISSEGSAKCFGLSAEIWSVINTAIWAAVWLQWVARFTDTETTMAALGYEIGLLIYAAFWGLYGFDAVWSKTGMFIVPVAYGPAFLVHLYFLMIDDGFGGTICSKIPWWEIFLASAYRFPMEIPVGLHIKNGKMPYAMANPFDVAPEPYSLIILGKTFTFKRGLITDGLISIFIGIPLAIAAAYTDLPDSVILGYNIVGILTLTQIVGVMMSHLPRPNPFRGFWTSKADTKTFISFPGIWQLLFCSHTGWIVNMLAFRKLAGY